MIIDEEIFPVWGYDAKHTERPDSLGNVKDLRVLRGLPSGCRTRLDQACRCVGLRSKSVAAVWPAPADSRGLPDEAFRRSSLPVTVICSKVLNVFLTSF